MTATTISTTDPEPYWGGSACARVGLLGNPSDGYGGRVIAMTVPDLQTHVRLRSASHWQYADTQLLEATVEALRTRRPELVAQPAEFAFSTSIPRQVGLSGSSAIVIAALRALGERADHQWESVELARTALEVETQVLGWTAGPQDRVVQAYQGLLDMDFSRPWEASAYEQLDPAGLPALFVSWDRSGGTASDVIHRDVRERWLEGDPGVRSVISRFAELSARGRQALDAGEAAASWPDLLDEAFELRTQLWSIGERDRELVGTARSVGAGASLAGSGGAIVGALPSPAGLGAVRTAFEELGAGFLVLSNGAPPMGHAS